MLRLDLTPEERETLEQLLEETLSDLRMEIADTDSFDFRQQLKDRKATIARLLESLKAGAGSG